MSDPQEPQPEPLLDTVVHANFGKSYRAETALYDALREVLDAFEVEISLVATIGILEVLKLEMYADAESEGA